MGGRRQTPSCPASGHTSHVKVHVVSLPALPSPTLDTFLTELRTDASFGPAVAQYATMSPTPAPDCPWPTALPAWLVAGAVAQGVSHLTAWQVQALEAVQAQRHVCVMAPAGAGAGLMRLSALAHTLARVPQGHALWLVPSKAQALRHSSRLAAWNAALEPAHQFQLAIYDGDTPGAERRAIKQAFPPLVLTTPEMLHAGILAYHGGWRAFFQELRLVIVEDVQRYSGALGAHLAHLLRRLARLATHYGAQPHYLLTSAPLANMAEVAQTLTAQACTVVRGTARRVQPQTRLLLTPATDAVECCRSLWARHQAAGLETLVLAPSPLVPRLQAQGVTAVLAHQTPLEAIPLRPYQSLVCLGVPPLSALHERLDWLGSGALPTLSSLIVQGQTPVERYLCRYPAVYTAPWEQALGLCPSNPQLTRWHLHCAAAELALAAGERYGGIQGVGEAIRHLASVQALTRQAESGTWVATGSRPHRQGRLRSYEPDVAVVQAMDGRWLARWTPARAFREAFPGAIWAAAPGVWRVEQVLDERRRVLVQPVQATYSTQGRVCTTVTERQIAAALTLDVWRVTSGPCTLTERLDAYEQRDARTGVCRSVHSLPARQRQWTTQGVWLSGEAAGQHTRAAWHTLVHAVLAAVPVLLLSEAQPLRGGVYGTGAEVEALFHDLAAGGNGTSLWLYQSYVQVLRTALQLLLQCDCQHGCPRCVGHEPCDTCASDGALARQEGIALLQRLVGEVVPPYVRQTAAPAPAVAARQLYLALSTQRSAEAVGGWQHKHLLGLGVAVTYDTQSGRVQVYTEETVQALVASLRAADLVLGFNTRDFDYQVLQPYTDVSLATLPTLALLDDVQQALGFRLSLRHLVKETLGRERPDEALQTLEWFQEGERERIVQQCRRDVELLQALVRHGVETGSLWYRDQTGVRTAVPVSWQRRVQHG